MLLGEILQDEIEKGERADLQCDMSETSNSNFTGIQLIYKACTRTFRESLSPHTYKELGRLCKHQHRTRTNLTQPSLTFSLPTKQ
jgi:hypothetical protein